MSTRMTRRTFLRLTAFGSTAVMLSACGAQATPTPTQVAPATKAPAPTVAPTATAVPKPAGPKKGGRVVVVHTQEPDRFWSPFTGVQVANEFAQTMNHSLLKVNDKNSYLAQLTTEVPSTQNGGVSADSLTWTIHLIKGITWHDGKPFTSADVKFTYDMMVLKGTDVISRVGWDQITACETPDEYTVVYKFGKVNASFLQHLANVPILPKHLLGGLEAKEFSAHKWFRAPVGLGPFMFKEWASGDHITVVRNPNYFIKDQPSLDEIVWRVIPDDNTILNMLQTGDADISIRVQDDRAELLDKMANLTRVTVNSITPWLIWANNNDPILKDVRVRQALAYGFDKEAICKMVFRGLSDPADGVISPQLWAYNPNIRKFRLDPAKAKALLEAAGWKDINNDGIREAQGVAGIADGTPLAFETASIAGELIRTQLLTLVHAQWKDIGVSANLRLVDTATMFSNMHPNNKFQTTYSYIGRTPDPDISGLYLDRTKYNNKGNYVGFNDPKVDQLLTDSLQTADQEKRKQLLWEAQAIIAEAAPQFFLGWRANTTAVNKRVHGYLPTPGGLELWNAKDWWVD